LLFFVEQAPVAQHNTEPTHVGSVTVGKPSHFLTVAESTKPRSNPETLLAAIIQFFKNNPAAE
jgi:hypothetical protein